MPVFPSFPVCIFGAAALTASVSTANPLSYETETGGSIRAYGQISPTWLGVDDGSETYGALADNAHSNSRVGVFVDQEYSSSGAVVFNFETALGAPSSGAFSQGYEPDWDWDKTKIRKVELIFSDSWGKLSLGQGAMATDGASGSNLSETTISSSRSNSDVAGGYYFRSTEGVLSDIVIKDSHRKWDGSRRFRIRYDTPYFGGSAAGKGFTFGVAYGEEILTEDDDNIYYDIAARYDDSRGDWDVIGAIGYGWIDGKDSVSRYWSGSASALHRASGLNGTIAGGGDPDTNGHFIYLNAGWIAHFFDVGHTAMAVEWYNGRNTISDHSNAVEHGIQIVQSFDDQNLEVYLSYDLYSFQEDGGTSYQDVSAVMAGIFWTF